MTDINKIVDHAERNCKDHGARLTTKRKQVLSSLLQSKKALSAYELIDLCREQYNDSLPATSMYRILEFLENEHLVHKLNLANKYVACAHIACDHSHAVPQFLICGECQKVKEINIPKTTFEDLQNNVEQAGFQLASPQIEMNCICEECASNAA